MKKIYFQKAFFKILFLFFSFLLFAFWANAQKTWSGAAGAAWNVVGNWTPAGIPLASDPVTINEGATPIVTAAAVCASVQINNSANNGITTSLTINSGQTLTVGGGTGLVTIGSNTAMGNNNISNTSLIVNGSLASGNINQSPGTRTAGLGGDGRTNLTISSTGIVTVIGNVTGTSINGKGTLTASASVIFTGAGTLNVTGTFTTTVFTPSTGIVNYNGTALQSLNPAYLTYGTLKVNNSAGVTLGAATTAGNLIIGDVQANSIFNAGGFQLTSTGALNLTSGFFNIGNGATATLYPAFATSSIASGTTVNYKSSSPQTIAGVNYANLTNSGNGNRTLVNSPTIGISGTFSPGGGTYTLGTSTVSFNGTSAAQTIPTFTFTNLIVNNVAGISSIAGNVTVNSSLALTNGVVTTGANKIIIPSGGSSVRTNGWVNGNLQKYISTTTAVTFEIGDASNYSPVTVNYATLTTAGNLTATVTTGLHPAIASSGLNSAQMVNRYWTLTSGGVAGNYDATCTFVAGDILGAANTANFVVRNYSSSSWATTTTGIKTSTSTQVTGLTTYGDLAVGEFSGLPTVSTQPSNSGICLTSNATFTSASLSAPGPTVQWQRSSDGGTNYINIIATTDGGKYSNYTTNTLTVTAPDITMNGYLYRSVYTNINGSVNSNAASLTITQLPTITTFSYTTSPFANVSAGPENVTLAGTNGYTGGTYTSDINLTINSSTGAITPTVVHLEITLSPTALLQQEAVEW